MEAFRLDQKKFPNRRQSVVVDSGEIKVSIVGPNRNENWTIPLLALDPNPTRARRRPLVPWFLAILLIVAVVLLLLVAVFSLHENHDGSSEFIFAFVFAIIAMQRLAKAFEASYNVLVFQSRTGRRLVLWFENPNKQHFHQFVEALSTAIAEERQAVSVPHDGSISSELKRLKELHDQGLLDADQFRAAVNRVVGSDKDDRGF